MAAGAIGRQLVAIEIADMACVAFCRRVLAAEWKFRRLVMVEGNRRPLGRGVTRLTLLAIAASMFILDRMARNACDADALIFFAGMTSSATNLAMCTDQGEFCF